MLEVVQKLLVVQEFDTRIREIERELKDIPLRQKAEEQRLSGQKLAVEKAEHAVKAVHSEIKQMELEVQARQERIRKLRQQQVEIKTNKEFAALESEIKQVEVQISGLEEKTLVLMDKIDDAKSDVEKVKVVLARDGAVVEKDIGVWTERAAELNKEVLDLRAQRKIAAGSTDSEWLVRYERVITRKDRALVPIQPGDDSTRICGGCHMKLPPAVYHSTRRQHMVTCDFCGRMLYSD
jgi:predicted  nucleic acid-binding Zn-ribbon protein